MPLLSFKNYLREMLGGRDIEIITDKRFGSYVMNDLISGDDATKFFKIDTPKTKEIFAQLNSTGEVLVEDDSSSFRLVYYYFLRHEDFIHLYLFKFDYSEAKKCMDHAFYYQLKIDVNTNKIYPILNATTVQKMSDTRIGTKVYSILITVIKRVMKEWLPKVDFIFFTGDSDKEKLYNFIGNVILKKYGFEDVYKLIDEGKFKESNAAVEAKRRIKAPPGFPEIISYQYVKLSALPMINKDKEDKHVEHL